MLVYAGKKFCAQYPKLKKIKEVETTVKGYVEHLHKGGSIKRGSKTWCIPSRNIPERDENLGITELWKYNVTDNYRMIYARFGARCMSHIEMCEKAGVTKEIGCDPEMDDKKERIILYWIGNHGAYEKWMGYSDT